MQIPCNIHATSMHNPCSIHAASMQQPCRSHATSMQHPCITHAASMQHSIAFPPNGKDETCGRRIHACTHPYPLHAHPLLHIAVAPLMVLPHVAPGQRGGMQHQLHQPGPHQLAHDVTAATHSEPAAHGQGGRHVLPGPALERAPGPVDGSLRGRWRGGGRRGRRDGTCPQIAIGLSHKCGTHACFISDVCVYGFAALLSNKTRALFMPHVNP